MILCSARTLVTAAVYKLVLGRSVSPLQCCGAACIVLSLAAAKLDSLLTTTTNSLPATAVALALIVSSNSVAAAVYTESLFKVGHKMV